MRYGTGINVTRKSAPRVTIIEPPNSDYRAEVRVDFGGLYGWFSEAEATALGKALIEAGVKIRADRPICTCASAFGEFIGCELHGIEADDTNRTDGSSDA